jgi:transcriptional antiterminator Rof (Rho-off)
MRVEADRHAALLATKEGVLTTLHSQIASLEEQLAALRSEGAKSIERCNALSLELQTSLEEVSALRHRVAELEGVTQQNHSSVSAVMQDLEVSLERKKELKQQLDHAQLAQRAAEKQVNVLRAQVQDLRETLTLQQGVVDQAQARETEHMATKSRLERLIADGEERFTLLQAEFTQLLTRESTQRVSPVSVHLNIELQKMAALARRTQRALDEKCAELESLHTHVTELLTSTTSPYKEALSARKRRQERETLGDKENVLTELMHSGAVVTQDCFEVTEAADCHARWHGRLVECSLQMYEMLVGAFQHMKVLRGDHFEHRTAFIAVEQLCVKLSLYQHRLHDLLAQTPWMAAGEQSPELGVPHEVSRSLPDRHPCAMIEEPQYSVVAPVTTVVAPHQAVLSSPPRVTGALETKRSPELTRRVQVASPGSGPVLRTVPIAASADDDHSVRASNDSVTLDELLASLTSNRSAASSNNSSMCSAARVHTTSGTSRRGRHVSHRDSADDALSQAARISAEIGEVSFDAFGDDALGATPPSIKRILRAADSARSGREPGSSGSKSSRRSAHDDSFDSVVSDLFNLSADSVYSEEDSALFYHYQDK